MCFCSINQSATLKSAFYPVGLRVPQTKLKEGILDIGIKK
jgi:hypothetical protein